MKEAMKLIGNTPAFQIPGTSIFVKLEKFNLGGSVKDRAVMGMMLDAQAKGILKEGSTIIEPTSGNTGIAISLLANLFGYRAIIVMPETMSVERRQLIKAYGAELILTPGSQGMKGAIAHVEKMRAEHPDYVQLGQFDNEANAHYHYRTTGQEILQQVQNIDAFVSGVGTGGTFTGVTRALKEVYPTLKAVVVEPLHSPIISKGEASPHKIAGISAGFVPAILDKGLIDEYLYISDEEAMRSTVEFVKETGILVGISSGANIAAARKYAALHPHAVVVTIAPDGGEKYLSVLDFDAV
ncbi:MAG: cysteine synthase A [Erysipelotrichaceae bacterium]